jgi:hypothetical protein
MSGNVRVEPGGLRNLAAGFKKAVEDYRAAMLAELEAHAPKAFDGNIPLGRNCCVVQRSKLSAPGGWTPFRHMPSMQQEKLAEIIGKSAYDHLEDALRRIVREGVHKEKQAGYTESYFFHPDMRRMVCERLLGEEWEEAIKEGQGHGQ